MSKIENCEASRIQGRLNVTPDDVSDVDPQTNQPDNDFKCPVTGKYVALTRNKNKEIVCLSDSCSYIDVTVSTK